MDFNSKPFAPSLSALTIGNFDGVHLGHQALITRTIEESQRTSATPALLTFEPHPREFLGARPIPERICSIQEKLKRIESFGIKNITIEKFDKTFANLSAEEFLVSVKKHFSPTTIVVGKNFFFGKNREGTPDLLSKWGKAQNIKISVLEPVIIEGVVVSSSEIRRSIQEGELSRVKNLMGFNHVIECDVVPGDGRGKGLGFPTLNSPLPKLEGISKVCLPPHGVYITRTHLSDQGRPVALPSITNFGIRPTFYEAATNEFFESHVLSGWSDRLSFKHISVEFLDRLRPELRFASKDELIKQIQLDIATANLHHNI